MALLGRTNFTDTPILLDFAQIASLDVAFAVEALCQEIAKEGIFMS